MPTVSKKKVENESLELIEDRIYVIRGQRVMLDSDLAKVYKVETRVLNQALKRNVKRFPSDFVFQLNDDEVEAVWNSSQFVMSSKRGKSVSTLRLYGTRCSYARNRTE